MTDPDLRSRAEALREAVERMTRGQWVMVESAGGYRLGAMPLSPKGNDQRLMRREENLEGICALKNDALDLIAELSELLTRETQRADDKHERYIRACDERDALRADARRWAFVKDTYTYAYGDGRTEPKEKGLIMEWRQGPWIRDGSNDGRGRPDTFPGWDAYVDQHIEKWERENECEFPFAAIAERSGGEGTVICPNCDTALPEGCSGHFEHEGDSCWRNRKEPTR